MKGSLKKKGKKVHGPLDQLALKFNQLQEELARQNLEMQGEKPVNPEKMKEMEKQVQEDKERREEEKEDLLSREKDLREKEKSLEEVFRKEGTVLDDLDLAPWAKAFVYDEIFTRPGRRSGKRWKR